MPCSWRRAPSPLEMGFYLCTFGDAPPRERKSRLGGSWTFACSRHHFRRREVCLGQGGLSSLCKAQPSFQVIYLSLHGLFVIPSPGNVTTHTGMASAGLRGVYAPFSKPFVFFIPAMLMVWEITLLLGSGWLKLMRACSMGVRSHHVRLSFSLTHKFFPQTTPIVGSWLGRSFIVDVSEPKRNRPNTMNLVKKWAQELGLSEGFFNGLTGS